MTAYQVPIQPSPAVTEQAIHRLESLYEIREDDVVPFLHEHPHLVPPLLEAWGHIERLFGPSCPVRLDVVVDRETPNWVTLFGNIRTSRSVEQAHTLLYRLDNEWYDKQPHEVRRDLMFDLEFV